jgi:transposase-like protein
MDGDTPNKKNVDMDAYSIEEFCRRHGISRSTYYLIQSEGIGPDEGRVKNRVLVTKEAALAWRQKITTQRSATT